MKAHRLFHNRIVAAALPILFACAPLGLHAAPLDDLFTRLQTAEGREASRIEREIWAEWSKSGSASADLLLQRGRDAMEAGDGRTAVEHFTALVDHAPDFAEGWNARATAYFSLGQYGPSITDIARVLTLNPRHFGAMAGLGAMMEELDRPEKALEAYRAALAIHPHLDGVEQAVERLEAKAAGQEL
ncbi:MAG: tetratricopeptide repeat protein [Cereibacter changlensis]